MLAKQYSRIKKKASFTKRRLKRKIINEPKSELSRTMVNLLREISISSFLLSAIGLFLGILSVLPLFNFPLIGFTFFCILLIFNLSTYLKTSELMRYDALQETFRLLRRIMILLLVLSYLFACYCQLQVLLIVFR